MAKSACADWEGSVEKMLPPINSAAPDWPGKGERRAASGERDDGAPNTRR